MGPPLILKMYSIFVLKNGELNVPDGIVTKLSLITHTTVTLGDFFGLLEDIL